MAQTVSVTVKTITKVGFVGVVKSKWRQVITTLQHDAKAAYYAALLLAQEISGLTLSMFERYNRKPIFVTRKIGYENQPSVSRF